jgi:general secretion pathway protein L
MIRSRFSRWRRPSFRWSTGIEVEESSLALVCLKQALWGIKLVDYLHVPSLPLDSEPERSKVMSRALLEFMRRGRHRQDNVTLSIPRRKAAFGTMQLPEAAKENLEQVVEFEFDRYFPFKREDCYFGYHVSESSGAPGQIRVQVVAVQRDYLDAIMQVFQGARIRLVAVESTSQSVGSYLHFVLDEALTDCLMVSVRPGEISLELWKGRELVFTRGVGLSLTDGDLSRRLEREVSGAQERFGIHHVFYCGILPVKDLAFIPEVSALGLLGPVANRVPSDALPFVLPACGAALRGLGRGRTEMNLLPQEFRKEGARIITPMTTVFLGVALVLGLGWEAIVMSRQQGYLKSLQRRIDQIASEVASVRRLGQETETLQKEIRLLRSLTGESPKRLPILKELTQLIPRDTYLTELRSDSEKVEVVGLAKSASDLIPILEASPTFRAVQFSSPITKRGTDQEMFTLRAELEREGQSPEGAKKARGSPRAAGDRTR